MDEVISKPQLPPLNSDTHIHTHLPTLTHTYAHIQTYTLLHTGKNST